MVYNGKSHEQGWLGVPSWLRKPPYGSMLFVKGTPYQSGPDFEVLLDESRLWLIQYIPVEDLQKTKKHDPKIQFIFIFQANTVNADLFGGSPCSPSHWLPKFSRISQLSRGSIPITASRPKGLIELFVPVGKCHTHDQSTQKNRDVPKICRCSWILRFYHQKISGIRGILNHNMGI